MGGNGVVVVVVVVGARHAVPFNIRFVVFRL